MPKKLESVVILSADRPTITGRVYPLEVLREAVKKLDGKPVFGTLSSCPGLVRPIDKISHVAKNVRVGGKELIADIEVLDTPEGEKLSKMLERLQFAPAGVGDMKSNEYGISEVSNYEIFSIDVTAGTGKPKS